MATKTNTANVVIEPAEWNAFFTRFTRDYRGAHATLEVLGADIGDQVMTEDRPFDGVAADFKDNERSVWITFGYGSTPEDHLTHGVHKVTAVRAGPPPPHAAAILEFESQDGIRTLLTVSHPGEYELPPSLRK